MKFQVFIHGIDVVEDILHYSGDDTHCVCVMEIPLHAHRNDDDKCRCTSLNGKQVQRRHPDLHGVCFSR